MTNDRTNKIKSNYTEKITKLINEAMDRGDGLPAESFSEMLEEIKDLQIKEINNNYETIKNFFILYIKNGQRINQNTNDYIKNIDPDLYELIDDITPTIEDTIKDAENQKTKQQAKGTLKPKVYFKDPLKTEIYNIYLKAFKDLYKTT